MIFEAIDWLLIWAWMLSKCCWLAIFFKSCNSVLASSLCSIRTDAAGRGYLGIGIWSDEGGYNYWHSWWHFGVQAELIWSEKEDFGHSCSRVESPIVWALKVEQSVGSSCICISYPLSLLAINIFKTRLFRPVWIFKRLLTSKKSKASKTSKKSKTSKTSKKSKTSKTSKKSKKLAELKP